jgi:hypothetical protein
MTWGGSYSGMEMLSVSIVGLSPVVPTPQTPTGTIVDTTPTYTWTKITNATQYQYAVYQGAALKYSYIVPASACGAATCSHTPAPVLPLGSYQWKVQADLNGAWQAYSALKPFTIGYVPVPVSPVGAITVAMPTYIWSAIPGATQYQYQLLKGTALVYTKTVPASACGPINCSNHPTIALGVGSYAWKVQAYVGGAWRGYSPLKAFSISPPKPKAGFWASNTGDEFYVTPAQTAVKDFAIYLDMTSFGCGYVKIWNPALVPISNNHFAFTGSFYGSGTFQSISQASGQDGLNNFYIYGCGTFKGGPWSYTALWQDSSQPSLVSAAVDFVQQLGLSTLNLPNGTIVTKIPAPK